jgi:hypothetical protein
MSSPATVQHFKIRSHYIQYTVKYLLKSRTVEPEKESFLGNGCVTHNNVITIGKVFFVRPVPRL